MLCARGEYVAFQDADDRWLPDFLEAQIQFLKLNDADLVFSDALLFGETPLSGRTFMELEAPQSAVTPESLMAVDVAVLTSAVLARKQPIFDVALFDETIKRRCGAYINGELTPEKRLKDRAKLNFLI